MKTQLNEFLNKELSRRDFLKMLAGALVMAIGVQNFITYFSHYNHSSTTPKIEAPSHGFGSSKFGR